MTNSGIHISLYTPLKVLSLFRIGIECHYMANVTVILIIFFSKAGHICSLTYSRPEPVTKPISTSFASSLRISIMSFVMTRSVQLEFHQYQTIQLGSSWWPLTSHHFSPGISGLTPARHNLCNVFYLYMLKSVPWIITER